MEYRCITISMNKLLATPTGFVMPLCQTCKTIDCDNPIETRKISLVGIKEDMKVFVRGTQVRFVVKCNGYTK